MYWILCILVCFTINSCICYTYIGTKETLRQNIADLAEDKLTFSNENLPFYEDELSDLTPKNNSEYDFIVIGAGSAGAVVASRLSEVENATVMLIEAGPAEYPIMDIPALAKFLYLSDQINWKYQTESSDKYCLGLTESKCNWARGKVMGGSSILNFMVASRGNKINYDEWASTTGDESWSYKNMLKYLKKLEDFKVKDVTFDSDLHNKGGPLHISSAPYATKLADAFIDAGKELGYPVVDYNGQEQMGFSYMQYTVVNGERWSTNRAYLHSAKNRKNLFLTRYSHVNRILINDEENRAYGVEFTKFDKKIVLKASKEIILCAGAINSPQILMLSGIGPAQHLLLCKVIKNASVGENLIDHLTFGGLVFKTNDSVNPIDLNIMDPKNPSIEEYITKRNGSLALGPGFEAISFFNVDDPNALSGNPNMEIMLSVTSGLKDPGIAHLFGISQNYLSELLIDNVNHTIWSLWPMITQPKSRGRLLLQSNNPSHKPKLFANYWNDPNDVRVMIKGIRIAIKIAQTKAFQKYDSQLYDISSLCKNYEYDSDAYWECILRKFGTTTYHQAGTCKMGLENDSMSVVNSRLKVIGIKRLRVADASVMPNIISGHTNVPTIAIAEKVSDIIKEDWGYLHIDNF